MSEQEWLDIFGDNLRDILIETGYSQKDLAETTGLSEGAISSYINKKRMPCIRALINISYELGISLDELMDFDDRIT